MSSFRAFHTRTSVIKYADDVTIVIPVKKNEFHDVSFMMDEIENFKRWCIEHDMSINFDKTKVLNINATSSPLSPVPLFPNVASLKLLGLIFNQNITWTDHFDFILSKLSRRLYVLRILKPLLSHDQLVLVFNAIFSSVMDYASQVFLNPGKGQDLRLLKLCKRAFYIIHGNAFCNQCNILNILERRKTLAMRLFKNARNDEDHILHHLVPPTSERSNRLILPNAMQEHRVE